MKTTFREFKKWSARYLLYTGIMLAMYGAVRLDALGGDTPRAPTDRQGNLLPETAAERMDRLQEAGKFNEGGIVESLELAVLLAVMLTSGLIAIRHPEIRSIAVLLGAGLGLAAIREQDYWFDQFAHGSWVVPATLLAVLMAMYGWRQRKNLWPSLMKFAQTPGWGLLVSGVLVTMVFARLMGQKSLWNHMVDSPRVARNLKNMVEESFELVGYGLMLCAMIEGLIYFNRRARRRQHAEHRQRVRAAGELKPDSGSPDIPD